MRDNCPEESDVVFNIFNFFKIDEIEKEQREGTIIYGSLAEVAQKREKQEERLYPFEENLMRNYDYLEELMKGTRPQAKILQFSGFFEDSLKLYFMRLEKLREINESKEKMDEHLIEVGDAYRTNG